MITVIELRERMQENPFRPFCLHTSDGKSYDVINHDMMFIKRNGVEIALDMDANSVAERFSKIALLHITAIEDPAPANDSSTINFPINGKVFMLCP
jgi:hypothetical protein